MFITPSDDGALRAILAELADVGGRHLKVYADVYVTSTGAVDRRSDALVHTGSVDALLQSAGAFRETYGDGSLRTRLGLTAPKPDVKAVS